MTTALAKKKTASPKTPKSQMSTKSTKSTETVTKAKTPAQPRKLRRRSPQKKEKKKGFFSCCAKKRKVKRSKSKKSGKKLARSPAAKKPTGGKTGGKSLKSTKSAKSTKKSIKEKSKTVPLPLSSHQKLSDKQKKLETKQGSTGSSKAVPLRSNSNEPIVPPTQQQSIAPSQPISTTPIVTTPSGTTTESMVTAPLPPPGFATSNLAPPMELKGYSNEVVSHPSPPGKDSDGTKRTDKKFSKDETIPEDDDFGHRTKSIAYPSHKFIMTQFVKDECRVRRWIYEDSIPLSMESNMKHMLKTASSRISACQNDREKRCELLKELKELEQILDI